MLPFLAMGWLHKVKRYDDEYSDYFVSYKRVCYEVDQTHKRNRLLHEGFKFTLFVFIFIIFSVTEQVEIRSQLNQAVRNKIVSTPFECGHLQSPVLHHVAGAGLAGSGRGAEAGGRSGSWGACLKTCAPRFRGSNTAAPPPTFPPHTLRAHTLTNSSHAQRSPPYDHAPRAARKPVVNHGPDAAQGDRSA